MTALLAPYDVEVVRADFPVLAREVHGRPLVYLDNASSSHKPRQVLDAERAFVEQHYSNVHRGVHTLSQEATDSYEAARGTIAGFIGAQHDEVVFTKNATEAYNLVAYSFGNAAAGSRFAIGPGDEVCVTEMEHHSNLVPWQMLCERTGATLRWLPLTDEGRLDLTERRWLRSCTSATSWVRPTTSRRSCSGRVRSARTPCSTVRSRYRTRAWT